MKVALDTFKVLRQFYNPLLVLLVLFPIFVGFFINTELSSGSWILISLIWMLPFTLLYYIFQKKIVYRLIVFFYFLVGFVEIGHWIIIGGPMRVNSILVMANTNMEETVGFFDLQSTYGMLILIPYTILFIFTFRNPPKIDKVKNKKYYLIGLSLIFCIFLGYVVKAKSRNGYIPRIASVSYIFATQYSKYQKSLQENELKQVDATSVSSKPQIFVLFLGESNSKRHMSLYGNAIKTTPLLENRDDIIVYEDAISGYSLTRESVPSMLSESNLDNKMDFFTSIDLLDIFHSAGFKTYWLSNQSPTGIFDNTIGRYAKKADFTQFVDAAGKSSLQTILDSSHDVKLVEPFIKVLEEKNDKKFIVIHLMGTHAAYQKRYPPEFEAFKGNSSREKTIAEYHNAMLYNDFIMDSLLTVLKSKMVLQENTVASAIFLSDHGENLYDEMDRVGHSYAETIPKINVEIPFFVWLSQSYKESYPDQAITIEANRNKPFITDDLFHDIMDISNIQSPYLEEARSVFSENFNDKRNRILADGKDYDLK